MNILKQIEQFYNSQIDKYKEDIIEELCHFFGGDFRELIVDRISKFKVIYCVKKEDLERTLATVELDGLEKKLIDYLLDEIETNPNTINDLLYIGSYGNDAKYDWQYMLKNDLFSTTQSGLKKSITRLDLYNVINNIGYSYINGLIEFIGRSYQCMKPEESFNLNSSIENLESRAYELLMGLISLIILKRLKDKNINFLSNKFLDNINYDLLENNTFKKAYDYFGDLLPRFIFNPSEVINLLGQDNFIEFIKYMLKIDMEINIDEVLEKMLEERFKNTVYTRTIIELPFIAKALKNMRAKEEQEKLEESQMHVASLLLKYLENYGNAKIYFKTENPFIYTMINFVINDKGKLDISQNYVIFDKPYSDKEAKNIKETIHINDYDSKNITILMAQILHSSIYDNIFIETDKKSKGEETCRSVYSYLLYQFMNDMLNLDTSDFMMWVKLESSGQINLLLNKHLFNKREKDNPKDVAASLELKIKKFLEKLSIVKTSWDKMQNARNEAEYKKAYEEWHELERKRK